MGPLSDQGLRGTGNSVTAHRLEAYGQDAARAYREGQPSMTAAVVSTIKHAGLSPLQVRRVVEIANVSAFLNQYKTADDKYVDFPQGPADPIEVFRALGLAETSGASMRTPQAPLHDYSSPPSVKISSRGEAALWHELGEGRTATKVASANPLQEVEVLHSRLVDLKKEADFKMHGLLADMAQAATMFYSNVKQAARQGHSLGEVLQLLAASTANTEHVKSAFAWVAPQLLKDEVFQSEDDLVRSFQKTASLEGYRPNTNHPMVAAYTNIYLLGEKIAQMQQAQHLLEDGIQQLRAFALSAANGKTASAATAAKEVAKEVVEKKPWEAWKRVRDFTAKHAPSVGAGIRSGAAHAISEDAAKSFPVRGLAWGAEKAVQYAPHLAVAGLGYNAYQGAKSLRATPTAQAALSYVPLTQENENAQNEAVYRAMQGY